MNVMHPASPERERVGGSLRLGVSASWRLIAKAPRRKGAESMVWPHHRETGALPLWALPTPPSPNLPAAGNAGCALRFQIGHHWLGVPEPGRSVQ